jgi:periodic tryptophan protein 1
VKDSHTDSVMALSSNKHARNILLSGGADNYCKVWDISKESCLHTFSHHSDKVQCVNWHFTEPSIFMSGSYDKSVSILDARYPQSVTTITLGSEIECIQWNPHNPQHLFVTYYLINTK